jgi:hypothetical protein
VVKHGDVTQRVGVEVIKARGVDVDLLIKKLIANAAAEFASTYYYYTILRMHLAGHEDYKEICEDARLAAAKSINRIRSSISPRIAPPVLFRCASASRAPTHACAPISRGKCASFANNEGSSLPTHGNRNNTLSGEIGDGTLPLLLTYICRLVPGTSEPGQV